MKKPTDKLREESLADSWEQVAKHQTLLADDLHHPHSTAMRVAAKVWFTCATELRNAVKENKCPTN